jgi:hypothetical protein
MGDKDELIVLNSGVLTNDDYIAKLTRECPGCKWRIAKEDGCNSATCPHCDFVICWHCGMPWATHGDHFKCNVFTGNEKLELSADGEQITEQELNLDDKKYYPAPLSPLIRTECVRIQHYQNRYRTHEQSKVFDLKDRDQRVHAMVERFKWDTTAEKSKKLALRLLSTLVRGRSITMWSYPRAYLMPIDDFKRKKFESDQGFLEMALEKCASVVYRYRNESYTEIEDLIDRLDIQINGLLEDS